MNEFGLFSLVASFFIVGWGLYYVSTALTEQGVFDVFARLRAPIFRKYQVPFEAKYRGFGNHWLWQLVTCPKCISIYVACIPTFYYFVPTFQLDWFQSLMILFGLAGLSRWFYSFER